jgi:hypothetical protein
VAFKRRPAAQAEGFDDPVDLYLRLSERGGPGPIWDHQAQVLRSWASQPFREARDVALELPTGAGKTLVAGLIGDFQRRTVGDRVAYLCLTRQLAGQTARRLTEYGIPNVLLTGRVRSWNISDRARYQSSEAVAVSTYSHVFNCNPALDDVSTLILDDAHGAADFVAKPWSLEIERGPAYHDVVSLIADALDPLVVQALRRDGEDSAYRTGVYLASPVGVAAVKDEMEGLLYQAAMASGLSESASYARQLLEGRIDRCLVYVAHRGLLIRPLVAPTAMHAAFDDPARRVYLSATLGQGGELERAFGRRSIKRIPVPKGWDKRGTGRRLFCFPQLTTDLSRNPEDVPGWVSCTIAEAGRAVAIAPDFRTTDKFVEECAPDDCTTLTADDVEDELDPFVDADKAVLLLSNRYDGIDLPDDDCRLVVLNGLPAKGDLQERFLYSSLGAQNVLQERIRARIAQGAGRATRNSRDFATVVVLGDDLIAYLGRQDVQEALHPDMHAEVEFGWRNSLDLTSAEMTANIGIFTAHGDEWSQIDDNDIIPQRDRYERVDPVGAAQLQAAARYEVEAWERIWSNDWDGALMAVRRVIDELAGGRSSGRYAALWHYLAMSIALRLQHSTGDSQYAKTASAYLRAARAAARGASWLDHLAAEADSLSGEAAEVQLDPVDAVAVANIIERLPVLGKQSKFEATAAKMEQGLSGTPHAAYEQAIVDLGLFAGATESLPRSNADAAPDGAWLFANLSWISWEAKSEAKPDGELGAHYTGEAGGHLRYVARTRGQELPEDSFGFIITPQQHVHPAAAKVAEDHLWLLRPADSMELYRRIMRAWRRLRTRNDVDARTVADIFREEQALPSHWTAVLRNQRISDIDFGRPNQQ